MKQGRCKFLVPSAKKPLLAAALVVFLGGCGSSGGNAESSNNAAAGGAAPVVEAFAVTTREDRSVAVTLRGMDADSDPLTFRITTPPQHGRLVQQPPNLIYEPGADFHGVDTFRYVAHDGHNPSSTAAVSITVTAQPDAPRAHAQFVSTAQGSDRKIELTGSDVDGDTITFSLVSQPLNGSLTGTLPTLQYRPDAGFHGQDQFSFIANDGALDSEPALVRLRVIPSSSTPAVANLNVVVDEDRPLVIRLAGDDPNGKRLTFEIIELPVNGQLSGPQPVFSYVPKNNFFGQDRIRYRADNGSERSNIGEINITVRAVNDLPQADSQVVTTEEGQALDITLSGADPVEGSPLTFRVTEGPSNGRLTGTAPQLSYTPDESFNGADSFRFVANDGTDDSEPATVEIRVRPRAFGTYHGRPYRNLFLENGHTQVEVDAKLDAAVEQLLFGNVENERIYFPLGDSEAVVKDINNAAVTTETQGYGMMLAVQLDRPAIFDRLWRWTRDKMLHVEGPRRGYLACCFTENEDGSFTQSDPNAMPDGDQLIVTALLFAAARWGDDGGIDYSAAANALLDAFLHQEENPANAEGITNLFDAEQKLVVSTPIGDAATVTNPSYHLPHYYEIWGRVAVKDNAFWCSAALASREFLRKASHPITGLTAERATFAGVATGNGGSSTDTFNDDFRFDAWRTVANIAMDDQWFDANDNARAIANRVLGFFASEGVDTHANQYTLEGQPLSSDHSIGLTAMNAIAALVANDANAPLFVEGLWNSPVPTGQFRYYDGVLYLVGLLTAAGEFRLYDPAAEPLERCPVDG